MLLTLFQSERPNLEIILSLFDDMHIKTSHILGGRGFGLATCHPKHSTGTKQSKKNETAAGVAPVLAAAVGFTMCVGHQLFGKEGFGELHQHLVAPVPDRRPAWTPSMLNR